VSDTFFIRARREVVLAAGSMGSPAILQRSGIGPGDVLIDAGVPVRHELPGVGENLQDHLQIRTIYQVDNTVTLNRRARTFAGRVAMGLEYLLHKTGPLTMPPSQLGAFGRSDPSRTSADLEWHVQPLSLDAFGDPLHRFPAMTPSVCNLRPTSRGWVRMRSPEATVAPDITLNYLSTDEDRRVAVLGMRLTRRIMAAPALARYRPDEFRPGPAAESDADLVRAAGQLGTTIFHPVGTCRMGHDDRSVVDDRLRLRGIDRLRVIDASVMPRITSGNTAAPTMMIAEKGARMLVEDDRRR
jgi:choline dehydrogenase